MSTDNPLITNEGGYVLPVSVHDGAGPTHEDAGNGHSQRVLHLGLFHNLLTEIAQYVA